MDAYTDETLMPWGDHKGKALKDVPAGYLLYLSNQDWIHKYSELNTYIESNRKALDAEDDEEQPDGKHRRGESTSYDDYQRNWRGI